MHQSQSCEIKINVKKKNTGMGKNEKVNIIPLYKCNIQRFF